MGADELRTRGRSATAPAVERWVPALAVRIGVVAVLLATLWYVVVVGMYRIDLDVYRLGAQAWLSHADLYGRLPLTQIGARLPFTYPPAAAILFTPLALVPYALASMTMTAVSVVALGAVLVLTLRRESAPHAPQPWAVLAVLSGALLLEPVRSTIGFGQINLVLMALVAADVLLPRTPWPRGALVGLAAAVKLAPIVFVLTFAVRRQRRAAATTIASFVAVTLAAWVVAPGDSWSYWSTDLWDTRRIGGPIYVGNQSLHAVLLRLGLPAPAQSALWLLGGAAIFGAAWVAMRRANSRGWIPLVLTLNALLVLLVSPVSWTHHWVWIVPLTIALWRAGSQEPVLRHLAVAGVALTLLNPLWRLPHGGGTELSWTWWEHVAGSSYVIYAVVVVVVVAVTGRPRPRRTEPGVDVSGTSTLPPGLRDPVLAITTE